MDEIVNLIDKFLSKELELKKKYYFLNRIDKNHRQIQWSSGAYKRECDKIESKIKEFLQTLSLDFDIECNKYDVASIINIYIKDKSIDDTLKKD
jgi:hypothetical protein